MWFWDSGSDLGFGVLPLRFGVLGLGCLGFGVHYKVTWPPWIPLPEGSPNVRVPTSAVELQGR